MLGLALFAIAGNFYWKVVDKMRSKKKEKTCGKHEKQNTDE
jgi:hypothetical protein